MVLRKQEDLVPRPLSHATNNPPYPTTPSEERVPQLPALSTDHAQVYSPDLNKSPAFQLKPLDEAQKRKEVGDDDDDSVYSDNEWDQSDDDTPESDLPNPLKIGGGKPIPPPATEKKGSLPDVLKAGPPKGMPIKTPLEKISPEPTGATSSSYASNASGGSIPLQTNNPYLKMQQTGQSNFGAESSQQVWGDAPVQAQQYAVELPSFQTPTTPTNHMAGLSSKETQPSPVVQQGFHPSAGGPAMAGQIPGAAESHPNQSVPQPSDHASMIDNSSMDAFERSYGHSQNDNARSAIPPVPTQQPPWDALPGSVADRQAREEQQRQTDHTFASTLQAPVRPPPAAPSSAEEEPAPALPPRRSQEEQPPPMPQRPQEELPPPMPLRPLETGIVPVSGIVPESPNTVMNRQRKETYQIKHIRWHDVNKRGIRTSPILTQNINGPCPLLALVNALVLSTAADMETALVETLRTREQVSLGLLLDAVFDELMSGRRGDAAQELPDVSDLYKFLLALHTGLNVNPMFVQDPDATDGTSILSALAARPGGFENTRDMKLYRTFNLPLMHGWLPEPGSDAYRAFDRIAKTYETSQYVQFQEEELDAKLQSGEALSTEEQQMFTDIHAIKEFLNLWPTQLTTYGLKAMRETLQPGQVAILFRNDHFSTLYKDPRTDSLVTLVTDQGYSTHDEIVWESLVDVNGQGSELFSGDFRPVGNNSVPQQLTQPPVQSMLNVGDEDGWTTVQRRGNQYSSSPGLPAPENTVPLSPTSDTNRVEQEDHDLALALQLQEEEDDRHRRSQEERRRRENQLSEHAISAQAQQRSPNPRTSRPGETPPEIPPRRNNVQTHRPANEPAPPPTYEEAATAPAYQPPQGHPANPNAPLPPQGSAYQTNSQTTPSFNQAPQHGRRNSRPTAQHPGRPGGRRQSGVVGPSQEDRDKCVVM